MSTTDVIVLDDRATHPADGGTRYEVAVVKRADGDAVAKASDQKKGGKRGAKKWAEPRYDPKSLLFFLDVNTYLRRATALKARVAAGLGWELVSTDDEKEPDEAHRAITAALGRELGAQLERFAYDLFAVGNGFLEIDRTDGGDPAGIYHARAASIRRGKMLHAAETKDRYYQVRRGKVVAEFAALGAREAGHAEGANEMIHLAEYDALSDHYGAPGWIGAMGVMLLDRTTVEHSTYLFKNGLMANFAVVVEGGKLSADQLTKLKEFIKQQSTGIENAGRGIVLQNEKEGVSIRIEPLNVAMKDLRLDHFRTAFRDEVVTASGTPPRLLGIIAAGQLGGGSEVDGQLKVFIETEIHPIQEAIEARMDEVLAMFGKHRWRFKLSHINLEDRKAVAEALAVEIGAQLSTVDEGRAELGRDPLAAPPATEDDVQKAAATATAGVAALRVAIEKAGLDGYDVSTVPCC